LKVALGQIVVSRAGRDAGRRFVVVGVVDDFFVYGVKNNRHKLPLDIILHVFLHISTGEFFTVKFLHEISQTPYKNVGIS